MPIVKLTVRQRAVKAGLTAEYVRSLLRYEPETGILSWRVSGHKRVIGAKVGTLTQCGYTQVRIDYKLYKATHIIWLIMTGEFPTKLIDHINGKRWDDRWSNLREATSSENGMNQATQFRPKTSQYKGVNLRGDRWRAYIKKAGVVRQIGAFATEIEAATAYNQEALKIFGDFAYLNQILEQK